MVRVRDIGWIILAISFLPFSISVKEYLPGRVHYSQFKQIPVICYHNIRPYSSKEDPLWIGESEFSQQLQSLYDSGYHTILPDQLYKHLTTGTPLPARPILISFDDSHQSHFTIARPVLDRFGFKAVFFVMTVTIGKKNYLSREEIKALSDMGHVIGCHTYDHPMVTHIKDGDWEKQIIQPKKQLERITGKPVDYFAYPFGVWNDTAVDELKKYRFKAAFQLTGHHSETNPLFTLWRIMVSGNWTGKELQKRLHEKFVQ